MPHKKRKCFIKEKPAKEYLTRQKSSKRLLNRSRRLNKTSRCVKSRNIPLYFKDIHCRRGTDDFVDNSSENDMDESFTIEIAKKRFSCPECDFTTTRSTTLVQHKLSHSLSTPDCSSKQACNKKTLRKHEHYHSVRNAYQCENCSSTFKNSSDLLRHTRYKHTHEKPFKCTKCDVAYVERSKLIRHMSTHSDVKSYQCLECSFTAPNMYNLRRHLRTHILRRPYKCTVCSSCFTSISNLKSHMEQIHQEIKHYCTTCFLDFNNLDDLENHMQKLHSNIEMRDEKPDLVEKLPQVIHKTYECNDCGLNFTQLRNLISHVMVCDRKPDLRRNISDSEQKISEFDAIQNSKTPSELMTIGNYLIRGEVILLPASNTDKYVMINIISERDNQQSSDDCQNRIKKEVVDEWGSELEWDSSEFKLENSEIKEEIVDEEIEPFYGFDLSDIQISVDESHKLNVQTCF